MTRLEIAIERLDHARDLPLPSQASEGAAGLDLRAALGDGQVLCLQPLARALVPTGLRVALPAGFEAQIRPRSGLALRHGLTVLNSPGTIDSDYRGEISVLVINLGDGDVLIARGDRIAQLVVAPVLSIRFDERCLDEGTDRGAGGFGSTGTS